MRWFFLSLLFSGDSLKSICNGVAGNASTQGVQMSTVFRYLRQTDPEYCSNWLDATLYAVYKHGDEDTLDYFIENRRDTPIHAAVRFSLITGISLSILCMLGNFACLLLSAKFFKSFFCWRDSLIQGDYCGQK